MGVSEYNGQMFAAEKCPVCPTFKKGNVCSSCGKTHEPNEHFYGSKSEHFHVVSHSQGTTTQRIAQELCEKCYAGDMHEIAGVWPENFAPHSDRPSKKYGETSH